VTRKDLETAQPGFYVVRCAHPKLPKPDDMVVAGPLPTQKEAAEKASALHLSTGGYAGRHMFEVLQVIGL